MRPARVETFSLRCRGVDWQVEITDHRRSDRHCASSHRHNDAPTEAGPFCVMKARTRHVSLQTSTFTGRREEQIIEYRNASSHRRIDPTMPPRETGPVSCRDDGIRPCIAVNATAPSASTNFLPRRPLVAGWPSTLRAAVCSSITALRRTQMALCHRETDMT